MDSEPQKHVSPDKNADDRDIYFSQLGEYEQFAFLATLRDGDFLDDSAHTHVSVFARAEFRMIKWPEVWALAALAFAFATVASQNHIDFAFAKFGVYSVLACLPVLMYSSILKTNARADVRRLAHIGIRKNLAESSSFPLREEREETERRRNS